MAVEVKPVTPRVHVGLSADAGASEVYVLPSGRTHAIRAIAVTVHPAGGRSAKLATSTRSPADIAAGNASWVDVQFGASTSVTEDSGAELPAAISAVRLSAVGGAAEAHLCVDGVDA